MHTLSYSFFLYDLCTMQPKFYKSVIDDVIEGVRDIFMEEGVDEQILKELKRCQMTILWREKTTPKECKTFSDALWAFFI
uniref:Uncharacterized protein n=1 Tax=Salvator merianae TaxID=96440 RepID=A0A8D0CEL9_SALMN